MSIKSRIKRPKLANPPTNFDEEQSSAITTSPLGEEARKDIQTWFADFWKAYNPENNHTGLPTGWEGMPFMSFDNRIVLRYQITHFMNQYVGDHSFDDYVSAGKALGYRDDIQTSFITRGFPDGTELEFLRRGAEDPEWAIRTWLTQSRLYSENIDVDIGGVTLKMINTPDTEELCFMMAAGWNEMARKIDIRNEIAAKGIIPEEYRDGEKWVLPFTNQESMTGIISNLMNHLVGPGENPSLESRELLEKFFKKYNLNATFGDRLEEIVKHLDSIDDIVSSPNAYNTEKGVFMAGLSVIKADARDKLKHEEKVYRLLKGTSIEGKIPYFEGVEYNDDVGVMLTRNLCFYLSPEMANYQAEFNKLLTLNPHSAEWRNARDYIVEYNLDLMAEFHTVINQRAGELGVTFEREEDTYTNQNIDVMEANEHYGNDHTDFIMIPEQRLHLLDKRIRDTRSYLRTARREIVHGDWNNRNNDFGAIKDFPEVREGDIGEDIFRFLADPLFMFSEEEVCQRLSSYISKRSNKDPGFRENRQRQTELHAQASDLFNYESGVLIRHSAKRDLTDPQHRAARDYLVNNRLTQILSN